MAKQSVNTEAQAKELIEQAKRKEFKSVYLLMGDEPYYLDKICDAIVDNCLEEWEKDFNETICYGADADVENVISAARRYPMMADRQLVVVKDAQLMKNYEQLALYCAQPLDSTVLVILMRGAGADKRKAFYKSVQKCGVVVESTALKDYQMPDWITGYYRAKGLSIDPDAARLLAESCGVQLSKIELETDKMLKNLPEGTTRITPSDIERNVGVSREFSIFELNKALSTRNAPEAVKIATYVGSAARFAMPMAISALYTQFSRVLRYAALLQSDPNPSQEEKIRTLGVSPYFFREYDAAVRNYPLAKCMGVISLLCEYDYKGKGGDGSTDTPASELLIELVTKILNI